MNCRVTTLLAFVALLSNVGLARAQKADTTAMVAHAFSLLEQHRAKSDLEIASEAARTFVAAIRNNPNDAVARYGLAATLINAKKTMTTVRQLGHADGEAMLVAKRELEKALDIDPRYMEAAELLAHVAEQTRDKKALARAFAILPPPAVPRDTLAEFMAREPKSAVDFVRRAAILFAKREDDAALADYNKGLAVLDDAGIDAYVNDVLVTASPQEAISLTDGSLKKRTQALHTFWKKRSVRGGISVGDRIKEHYHRLATARARYAIHLRKGEKPYLNIYGKERKGIERELDDRGLIYVRYGEPSERIRGRGFIEPHQERPTERGERSREAWAYRDSDGRFRTYYFIGGRLEADLLRAIMKPGMDDNERAMFLESLAKIDGRYAFIAARLETIRNYEMMARVSADPQARLRYQQMAAARLEDASRQADRIAESNRNVLFAALDADAAHPRFERPLILFHDFATFRGKGCTDVVWSVAAPTNAYRLSVAVADTFTWETQSVDTVVMKGSAEGTHLRSTGVLCTTPDYNAYVRFTASTDSVTGVTTGGELRVPDYSGSGLLVSDLLFARNEEGPFVRGNARLALVPPRQFRQGEAFRLFYEIYNLKAGDKYRTEMKFDVKDGNPFARLFSGKRTFTVSFEGEATTAGLVQEIRTLAPEIEDGEVELTVKITSLATGESATVKEKMWLLAAPD